MQKNLAVSQFNGSGIVIVSNNCYIYRDKKSENISIIAIIANFVIIMH